ncbi:hypothetical protein MCW_00004 [Cardidatus Bartonella washoeensis 085-0475]|uniref:Major facilitator superfamily (MFS) profile domain-containing protein n=1 Tax=Cardidatus Bartonella washoeensis 085-0475 TaxID=1094564 RepID=J0QMI4_9HYPH|nr:hypothetical protein MCW_00004 [Bartonella washoeensis 085-0475]
MVLCATFITLFCFKSLKIHAQTTKTVQQTKKGLDIIGLLRKKNVVYALSPLIITIILTSALNVLSIVRIRTDLNLSAETYGMIASMISLGLVVGPLCFSNLFHRFGNAAGASLAAATIGFAIFCFSLTHARITKTNTTHSHQFFRCLSNVNSIPWRTFNGHRTYR